MKTAKVRIPVAVDPKGRWYAYGWNNGKDAGPLNMNELLGTTDYDTVGPGEQVHWLIAEMPLPESVEIMAVVEDART